MAPGNMAFGQSGLNSNPLQASHLSYIQFDPSGQLFGGTGVNQILGSSQTQNSNQILGSLMPQR